MSYYGNPAVIVASNPQYAMAPVPGQGIGPNVVRTGEMSFWSTYNLGIAGSAISTERVFFTTPQGQTGQGFSRNLAFPETNLREGGRIPSQFGYAVRGIAAQPYACVPATGTPNAVAVPGSDILNLQHEAGLQWDLNGSTIDIAPISCVGAGGGVFGATADTGGAYGPNASSQVALNNGASTVWTYQTDPLLLPANQTFSLKLIPGPDCAPVRLDSSVSGAELRLRIAFFGLFARQVPPG